MSDKKRSKRRKDEYTGPGGAEVEIEKPSNDEYMIAKWIKKNVPTKKTKFLNHHVEYFTASKALDALMTSKFAEGNPCLFPNREIAIDFLDTMLTHKFFHRAKKVPVSEAELRRGKKSDNKSDDEKTVKKRHTDKIKDEKASADDTETGNVADSNEKPEKKKRKIRLDMHPDQVFVDGGEAYVWIYDPIPMHYWLFGALVVIGAIVICLFPLWPPMIRKGVYYLSIAAAGFLVFILGLAALRFVVFCIVWLLTASKHHIWIFPNLTEDVGFFASFWPLYTHEYRDGSNNKNQKKKHKKDKDSDGEDEGNVTLLETTKIENIKENETGTIVAAAEAFISNEHVDENQIDKPHDNNSKNSSEVERDSDSESSHRSTDKDFEIVNTDDVDTS